MAVFESTKREYHTAEMCVPAVFRKIQVRAKKKERERDKVQGQQYFRMETIQLAI